MYGLIFYSLHVVLDFFIQNHVRCVHQELTEKMDTLLLEKAEIQQSLALSRKDLEKNKKHAKVKCTQHSFPSVSFFSTGHL